MVNERGKRLRINRFCPKKILNKLCHNCSQSTRLIAIVSVLHV